MKTKIVLMVVLLVFVMACGSSKDVGPENRFVGGTEGLKMEFLQSTPPDEIFDDGKGELAILVNLDNVGEATVLPEQGYVEIIGINPLDFGVTSQQDLVEGINRKLEGRRKNFEGTEVVGGKTVVEFPRLRYLPDIHGNTPITIRAELCYDYATATSTNICVKRDVLSTGLDTDKICDVAGAKDPQNSGAPVHITSLKEAPVGDDRVQLIFEIEHVGGETGQIYRLGSVCDDAVTNFDRNKVLVRVTSDVNGRFPECSGLEEQISPSEGFVTLFDGQKRAVTCTLDLAGVNSIFEELFTVDLVYRYGQYIQKEVVIRDVSTG